MKIRRLQEPGEKKFTAEDVESMRQDLERMLRNEDKTRSPWIFGALPLQHTRGGVVENPTPFLLEAEPHITDDVASVIDLGCGLGRDSLYLYRRGFTVYAVDRSEQSCQFMRKWGDEYRRRFGLRQQLLADVKSFEQVSPEVFTGPPKVVLFTNSLTGLARIERSEIPDDGERIRGIDARAGKILESWTSASTPGDLWVIAGFNDADKHPLLPGRRWDSSIMFTPSSETCLTPKRLNLIGLFPEDEWQLIQANPNRQDPWELKEGSFRNRSVVIARKKVGSIYEMRN